MKFRTLIFSILSIISLMGCKEEINDFSPLYIEVAQVEPATMTYTQIRNNRTEIPIPPEGSRLWFQQIGGSKSDIKWEISENDQPINSGTGTFDSSFNIDGYADIKFAISDLSIASLINDDLVPYRYICIDIHPSPSTHYRHFTISLAPTPDKNGTDIIPIKLSFSQAGAY